MPCPVIKDERVIKALEIGQEMKDFLEVLKCPKAKEMVQRWNEIKKDCPN